MAVVVGQMMVEIGANVAKIERDLKQIEGRFSSTFDKIGRGAKSLGVILTAGIGLAGVQKAWSLVKIGAEFEEQQGILDNLAKKYRSSAQDIVQSMSIASDGMVSDAELMKVALGGIAKGLNPEQLTNLADAARILGDTVGMNATQALNELTAALETGRVKGLKGYLGTSLDLESAFGDLTSKLSAAEKSQAMYAMTMLHATKLQMEQKDAVDSTADTIEKLEAKYDNLTHSVATFFKKAAVGIADFIEKGIKMSGQISDTEAGIVREQEKQAESTEKTTSELEKQRQKYEEIISGLKKILQARKDLEGADKRWAAYIKKLGEEIKQLTKDIDAQGGVALAVQGYIEGLQNEAANIFENSKSALDKFEDQVETLNKLLSEGYLSVEAYSKAYTKAWEDMAGQSEKTQDVVDDLKYKFDDLKQSIEGWGKDSAQALVDFTTTGKNSFSDLVNSIMKDMLKMMYYQSIFKPLFGAISSIDYGNLGKYFGMSAPGSVSAMGNVFSGGRMMAFAHGGVVNGPTFFPMANGYGLMGEAGPEAVMPLKRGSDGRLGVEAAGGGMQDVNITLVNKSGIPLQASMGAMKQRDDKTAVKTIILDLATSDPLIRSILGVRK